MDLKDRSGLVAQLARNVGVERWILERRHVEIGQRREIGEIEGCQRPRKIGVGQPASTESSSSRSSSSSSERMFAGMPASTSTRTTSPKRRWENLLLDRRQ